MRTRRTLAACAVVALAVVATSVASGQPRLPRPGTPAQVAALVAASSSIQRLPKPLLPPLSGVPADNPAAYYGVAGRHCDGPTKCVFGDRSSTHLIVLFGDSHAQMWLPAFVPVAQAAHDRLALVWESGCPAAAVSVWDAATHATNYQCNTWRKAMIGKIKRASPFLVLLASRTSDIPGPGNRPTTDAAWQAGLEQTIAALRSATTKVAVVGDITVLSPENVVQCLAVYATSVQTCAVKNPNGKTRQHFAAELAAATYEGVPYLDPQPWLCTTTCSPVIGNMVAYWDSFHVTSTYAEYLSGVWAATLKPLLVR
jgi:hypothetical protein